MANTLTFANQTLTDANIFGGITYTADLNTGDEFTIGNTSSACVQFTTDTQLPLYSKDSTNGVFTWTKDGTARGKFYITEVKKNKDLYSITAYDAMYLLDNVSVSALSVTYPATTSTLAAAIAAYIGCTVSGTIWNNALSVSALDTLYTMRAVLGFIAEASGGSVKIDASNHICFMYYADSGTTISAANYKSIEIADYTCAAIDNVTIINSEGETQAWYGSGSNSLFISGNPFMEEALDSNAQIIYNLVSGFAYAPLTCELFDDDDVEVGTIVTFGSTPTLVMRVTATDDGATAVSVGSDTRSAYNRDAMIVANEARSIAVDAQTVAGLAQTAAGNAATAAANAATAASNAQTSADNAQAAAGNAQTSADTAFNSAVDANVAASGAISQLDIVQNIVGVLQLLTEHGQYSSSPSSDTKALPGKWYFKRAGTSPDYTYSAVSNPTQMDYILTEDTAIDATKTYYIYDSVEQEYVAVDEPDVSDIGTYYEYTDSPHLHGYYELVGIDQAITNYVSSHLVLDSDGLWLQTDSQGTKVLLSATRGVVLYGENGAESAVYGSTAIIGPSAGFHIEIDGSEIGFYIGTTKVARMNTADLYVTNSLSFGNFVFKQRQNGHFTLKLIQ